MEITKKLYARQILIFGIRLCLHLKLRYTLRPFQVMTHCFSNETSLVIYKGWLEEIMILFSGSSITSGQAPGACKNDVMQYILDYSLYFVFIHYVLLFSVISIFSSARFLQLFCLKKFSLMFRALNETFVEEVNGAQAAVSGKQFVTMATIEPHLHFAVARTVLFLLS